MLAALLLNFVVRPMVLGSPFQDHMVLQQRFKAPIWGKSFPRAKIYIDSSWGSKSEAVADEDGDWIATLQTPRAGGPHTITVAGDGEITLRDVLIGEVWLCSGQSNMEMTVRKPYPPPLPNQEKEVAGANFPNIRMFNVGKAMSKRPQPFCEGSWLICSPDTVGDFSAAGYFFARELHRRLGVPVGIIHASWGGTPIEFWMSERGIQQVPDMAARLEGYRRVLDEYDRQHTLRYERILEAAEKTNGWADPNHDDADWKREAPVPWSQMGLKDFDGYVWYRAEFELASADSTGTLVLGRIDDADVTYVNGQRVGSMELWSRERVYSVPRTALRSGKNVVAVRVRDDQGEGGLIDAVAATITVGDQVKPLTSWRWKTALDFKDFPAPPAPNANRWSMLYNGMIHPVQPYGIKGFLWYQGESNVSRAYQYRKSFPAMIEDWRYQWDLDLPFYYVQIAPWTGYADEAAAELREAQLLTLDTRRTGMVVTTDITGDLNDIHPIDKQSVGLRLARLALFHDYGKPDAPSGPIFRRSRIEHNQIICEFHEARGLRFKGEPPTGFVIAGEDGKFVPAKVKIEDGKLIAWSESVPSPKSLRYGWGAAVIGNLENAAGLPASPFRTDDWPASTREVKW